MIIENHPTNASISTMWALHKFADLYDFFRVSAQLGFKKFELNHQVDSRMLEQVNLDHYQFSSIHEPCPADISTKEMADRDWLISATNEDSRVLGVNAVKKSIDLARRLDAPVVVVHCGTIPCDVNYEGKLRALYNAGKTQSNEYLETKQQFIDVRKSLVGPHLLSVKKSLSDLIEYADQFMVQLGLENRYHYMDIPSIEEMADLLLIADSASLGFVYDVGHAQALDRLGFYPHEEWLKRFSNRMLGCHLHDVIGIVDHYAPGLGEMDFSSIANYLPEHAFRTFEMLPGNTLAQVKDGVQAMLTSGCIRYI